MNDKIIVMCVRMVNSDSLYSFNTNIQEESIQKAISRGDHFPIRFEDIITGETKYVPSINIVSIYRVTNFSELCHIRTELIGLMASLKYINVKWDDDNFYSDAEQDKRFVGRQYLINSGILVRERLDRFTSYVAGLSE